MEMFLPSSDLIQLSASFVSLLLSVGCHRSHKRSIEVERMVGRGQTQYDEGQRKVQDAIAQ